MANAQATPAIESCEDAAAVVAAGGGGSGVRETGEIFMIDGVGWFEGSKGLAVS